MGRGDPTTGQPLGDGCPGQVLLCPQGHQGCRSLGGGSCQYTCSYSCPHPHGPAGAPFPSLPGPRGSSCRAPLISRPFLRVLGRKELRGRPRLLLICSQPFAPGAAGAGQEGAATPTPPNPPPFPAGSPHPLIPNSRKEPGCEAVPPLPPSRVGERVICILYVKEILLSAPGSPSLLW